MPTATLRPNILHNYANYTYNIQLWAITKDAFNGIGKGTIVPGKETDILSGGSLLISDAGVGNGESRDANFPVDFVLDNIEIESLVGNKTSRSRSVDALRLKFEIIEPYTVTLLDRLIRVALSKGVGPDFKTLIYALKIQFYGYDDLGKPVAIDKTTKVIPFSLLNMEFNVTNKGAVYKCEGIPTQNLVMTMLDNNIPFHVDLEGQKIKDLFNGKIAAKASQTAANTRTDTVSGAFNNSTTVTKGIAFALNENEIYKYQNGTQEDVNEYYFEFDQEILDAEIVDPQKVQDISRAFSNIKGAQGLQVAQQGRVGALTIDPKNVKMSAQAGTKITDFINSALSISTYMTNQAKQTPDKGKPLKLWKIFPKLEIKKYDRKLNFYSRKVTYVVKVYEFYGEDHPNFGQKTLEEGAVVKQYDYIFTGLNKDVIKANLDFKVAFWEVRNGVKQGYTENIPDGTGKEGTTEQLGDNATDRRKWGIAGILNTNGLANWQHLGGATNKLETIAVGEIMSKLMDNGVDLINLDIEIVGDPDWIQQDNVLYGTAVPSGQKTLSNGTITYHDSVTCFRFNFKSPVKDYDPITGLLKLDGDTETSSFSGLYQVLTVTSNFRKGRFSQKLNNIRIRVQDEKETGVARAPGAAAAAAATAENRANNNTTTPNQGTPASFVVGTVLG